MIWDPSREETPRRSALVAQLAAELSAVCGRDLSLSEMDSEELARAVEHFLEEDVGDEVVDPESLVLLAAQALQSLGKDQAARRFLVFGAGFVRPAEWEVTTGESMWVLDLKQISVLDHAPIELLFFSGLTLILEALADVWDGTQGRGVLGLRHVCSAVCCLLADPVKGRRSQALVDEVMQVCGRKLASLASARGWQECPRVLNLDI